MSRRSLNVRDAGLVISFLAVTQSALAHHAGEGAMLTQSAFASGALHPLLGIDHMLAMVAVGLWAAQIGGRALWLIPATFVSVMLGGAALGAGGVGLPLVEAGILTSVIVLGLAIVCALRLPLYAAAAGVGVFALLHGHAHGSEMPATGGGLLYAAGFALATAALHLLGIAIGMASKRLAAPAVRIAGAAVACGGVALWACA